MRTVVASLILVAACGGTSPPPAQEPPPVEAPPPADPTAVCDVFTTITFDIVYDGACAAPASISLDYNPTAPKPIDLTEGSADPADVMVTTERFEALGCTGAVAYAGAGGILEMEFHATGPGQVAGTGTWRPETGAECPARLTGHWKTWTEEP